METIRTLRYQAPCGELLLGALGGRLCLCDWRVERDRTFVERRLCRTFQARLEETTSPVTEEAARQLDDYFEGRRHRLDMPLLFAGTPFQQAVWQELLRIPYGSTCSYAALAARIGRPRAVRAVANANRSNALSLFVPCHRVVGSDGAPTGYAGGVAAKAWLLALETRADSVARHPHGAAPHLPSERR